MKEKACDRHVQFKKLYKKMKKKIFVSTPISLLNSAVANSELRQGDTWGFYTTFFRLKSAEGFHWGSIRIYDMTFT